MVLALSLAVALTIRELNYSGERYMILTAYHQNPSHLKL
jgi:hypothetical protein